MTHGSSLRVGPFALVVLVAGVAAFAGVAPPAEVAGVLADRDPADVTLTWTAVATDIAGEPTTVAEYYVYRGDTPDFVPDKDLGSNRIGTSATTTFVDVGATVDGIDRYYRVSAVAPDGLEGATKPSRATSPATLTAAWTDTAIDLSWTDAQPSGEVASYVVYYGQAPGQWTVREDVGLVNAWSLNGLAENVVWYAVVVPVDLDGNEGAISNEVAEVVAGRITMRAHDDDELCWGASKCTPADPDKIQRSDGWQLLVPADFPPGNWTRVNVTFTMDSKLCDNPTTAPDRCGDTNPGTGWNPCGDPWDRTAHLFLVLDDCIEVGGSCIRPGNLELIRAITPFGTDAPAPDGNGRVGPRALTLDVTPYAPLLDGRMYVGAEIGHFVPKGWWVTSEFYFSKRPEDVSPKPPADGFQPLFFGGVPPATATVSIPPTATQVVTRLFTTGHGGSSFCDGGSSNGQACTSSANCPGGSCQNCDEFCHRENQILVDSAVAFATTPWRDCCWPRGTLFCSGCQGWNSCGYPSCTFDRAGWCPGEVACHYDLDAGCDQDLDMTAHFPPGGTYDVDYNLPVRNGSWSVSLMLYWYEN